MAAAHKILIAIYHMLSQQVPYNDLGDLCLDRLNKTISPELIAGALYVVAGNAGPIL